MLYHLKTDNNVASIEKVTVLHDCILKEATLGPNLVIRTNFLPKSWIFLSWQEYP